MNAIKQHNFSNISTVTCMFIFFISIKTKRMKIKFTNYRTSYQFVHKHTNTNAHVTPHIITHINTLINTHTSTHTHTNTHVNTHMITLIKSHRRINAHWHIRPQHGQQRPAMPHGGTHGHTHSCLMCFAAHPLMMRISALQLHVKTLQINTVAPKVPQIVLE